MLPASLESQTGYRVPKSPNPNKNIRKSMWALRLCSASIGEHSVGTTAELAHESVARKLAWGDYSDITSELGESAQFHPTITDKLFLVRLVARYSEFRYSFL